MDYTVPNAAFGWWFAGLTDGEGSFLINKNGSYYDARFQINLRADDRPLLEYIQRTLSMGHIYAAQAHGRTNPAAMYRIASIDNAGRLVRIFDTYPLLSKKRHDFEVWKRFVRFLKDVHDMPCHLAPERLLKTLSFQKELQACRLYLPV